MQIRRLRTGLVLALAVSLTTAADTSTSVGTAIDTGIGEVVAHIPFEGGAEIDFDGRYAYVGQINGKYDRQSVAKGQEGGIRVIDLVGGPDVNGDETDLFEQVGYLNCPGTDNYVRYMDPDVFGGDYVAMAHHGNLCTKDQLRKPQDNPRQSSAYGGFNGLALVDVSDPTTPEIADVVGHWSAHTVMPHPTRPYLYILPGGLANGTAAPSRISPTGIVEVVDGELEFVNSYEHNVTGCHDLGFSADGNWAYCAGAVEVQVWDISGDKIEAPEVVHTITNPAIMFPHNAVISPDGRYLLINDEAFGFHTCEGEAADLYGSLWIYDISVPDLPILAGRISPPAMPGNVGTYTGWVQSWCAAHNYNFVPGTNIVVASWFAGGMTAHDISDPLNPELVAAYQPGGESVMWSAHYYGGYVLTGDMGVGTEILDIPALREAEAAAAAAAEVAEVAGDGTFATGSVFGTTAVSAPRVDRTAELVPDVLPARPARPAYTTDGGFCVIPGVGR